MGYFFGAVKPGVPNVVIPFSDPTKGKMDIASVITIVLAWFHAIPWPELAAFAAFVYTILRIIELVWGWLRR